MLIKFIKYFVTISLFLFFSFVCVEANNKIKIDIFSNEESCWTCLKGIDIISKLELENIEPEITLYFCHPSRELLNSLLRDYELEGKINTFLDPLCLYAKNYDFSSLPAIIIKDTKDSVILKEIWGNPHKYTQLIRKIDNDFISEVENGNLIEGLEFIKTLTLKDKSQNEIFNNRFSGFYNYNNNKYYGFIGRETILRVFDSNGITIDEIDINQDGINCFIPMSAQLTNDSNIIWADISLVTGDFFYYSLNLNTKLINKKKPNNKVDNAFLYYNFIQVPNTNKFVFALEYDRNIYLNDNSKLLLMIDENDNIFHFGRFDTILSTLRMSFFMWNFVAITADNSSNIYSLLSLSNNLTKYDSNGNYIKTIHLEFEFDFLEKPVDLPEDIQYTDKKGEIYQNFKKLYKLFVLDDEIFTIHNIVIPNFEELKFRDKKYWLTRFEKNGKRIGNTISLPINFEPIYIRDNKILIQNLDSQTGKIFLHWYKIPNKI